MDILKEVNNDNLCVKVIGRLDTITNRKFDEEIISNLDNVEKLILDFSELTYISSIGLRSILVCQKQMVKKKGLIIKNPTKTIREILNMTGFSSILNVE